MSVTENPTEIEIDGSLAGLIRSCERHCVAACCGIEAFDFSPVFLAAYVAADCSCEVDEAVRMLGEQVDFLEGLYCVEPLQDKEYSLSSELMNQLFSTVGLRKLLAEIRHNLSQVPEVLELSDSLRLNPGTQADSYQPTIYEDSKSEGRSQ